MRDITYDICEEEEDTMKCSLEEYLQISKSGKLPALLRDIFIYLGARKYVKHVIDPPNKKLVKTIDSETTIMQK